MKEKYQGATKAKIAQVQTLRREFEIIAMKEGEFVNDYFARTLVIANKMKIQGEEVKEIIVVEKIFRYMTKRFNYVVCAIEESNDVTELTVDQLQRSLLVHEARMKGNREEEQALKVTNTSKNGGRGR